VQPGNQTLIEEVKKIRRDNSRIQFHWKTTTCHKTVRRSEIEFARFLMTSGGFDSYFDAQALTTQIGRKFPKSMYWDDLHFEGIVYSALNQALIAYLYSLYVK